jgi:carbon monoxide dehydrogenase subunit G
VHLEGTVEIAAPRQRVWDFLTDPHAVASCAPGLESVEVIEPERRFKAVASLGLGSIKTRFTVNIDWVEKDPPAKAVARAHGTASGSTADVNAEMLLSEVSPAATALKWTAEVTITGTIASLASRMMGSVAQKISGQFFDCVRAKVEG